jgi:hypothetical protein
MVRTGQMTPVLSSSVIPRERACLEIELDQRGLLRRWVGRDRSGDFGTGMGRKWSDRVAHCVCGPVSIGNVGSVAHSLIDAS